MTEPSFTKRDGACATIVLNRPAVGNALDAESVAHLEKLFGDAVGGGARLVVFAGAGRNFCTGFDLSALDAESDASLLLRFVRIEQFLQEVYFSPVPTLSVGRGRTFGAGADLFAACDNRLALPSATFCFPGPAFGLVLGTSRLAELVGVHAARRIALSGDVLTAQQALSLGLVTQIAESDEHLDALVQDCVAAATRLDAVTVKALRRATMGSSGASDMDALVRSAARSGLAQRIRAYRDNARRAPSG